MLRSKIHMRSALTNGLKVHMRQSPSLGSPTSREIFRSRYLSPMRLALRIMQDRQFDLASPLSFPCVSSWSFQRLYTGIIGGQDGC
jgi:hypothetical protein